MGIEVWLQSQKTKNSAKAEFLEFFVSPALMLER